MSFFHALLGSGSGYNAYITAWITKLSAVGYTSPNSTVLTALDAFTTSLDGYGLMTRMKTGYILHSGSVEAGTVNIKDPNTYQTTLVNSPIWSEGNGTKSGGVSYISQPFYSDEYAGIESDLTTALYVSESSTATGNLNVFGARVQASGTLHNLLRPLNSASTARYWHYGLSSDISVSNNHQGLYILTYNSGDYRFYKDGSLTSLGIGSTTAPTIHVKNLILAGQNDTGGLGDTPFGNYTKYLSTFFQFNSFSTTDAANFKTAFDTYKTAVGLP